MENKEKLEHDQNGLTTKDHSPINSTNSINKVQGVKIGYATFKGSFSKTQIYSFLAKRKKNIIQKKRWTISCSSQFPFSLVSELFDKIQSCQCSQLQINTSQNTSQKIVSILSHIEHISFTNLIRLTIEQNSITSIESLAFLDMQNLKYLQMGGNQISNLQPLVKTKLKQLQYVQLYNNCLKDSICNLSKLLIGKDNIYLRFIMVSCGHYLTQRINFLAKLEKSKVSPLIKEQLKYYNGQSQHSSRAIALPANQKIILQHQLCKALKRKFEFQRLYPY